MFSAVEGEVVVHFVLWLHELLQLCKIIDLKSSFVKTNLILTYNCQLGDLAQSGLEKTANFLIVNTHNTRKTKHLLAKQTFGLLT